MMKRAFFTALAVAFSAVPGTEAIAQSYPNKPIRVVYGASPGSGADFLARHLPSAKEV